MKVSIGSQKGDTSCHEEMVRDPREAEPEPVREWDAAADEGEWEARVRDPVPEESASALHAARGLPIAKGPPVIRPVVPNAAPP